MSDNIGWLVVSETTGYLLEATGHAAKIFDTLPDAKSAKPALGRWQPTRLTYTELTKSLLDGSAFCFTNPDGHQKFLRKLRNDLVNKAFAKHSQDAAFVRWRVTNDKTETPAPAPGVGARVVIDDTPKAPAPAEPPVEAPPFNPSILVR